MKRARKNSDAPKLLEYILRYEPRTIGIDGSSGSGKTTLAKKLGQRIGAYVLPFDFFHKHERKNWSLKTDISDFEDFDKISRVIKKILEGKKFVLHNLYNHSDGTFTKSVVVAPQKYLIVEGLFATKLDLDFKIFLNVDPETALKRGKERDLRERNLNEEQWVIKKYLFHDAYSKLIPGLRRKADMVVDTTTKFPEL